MQSWLKISLLLSVFGFFKEFRPSEPFIFEFLTGPWRNMTSEQINQDVFPIGTYSYLTCLVFVFLATDLCRYKPFIILLGVCGITLWSFFLWTTSLIFLQIAEVLYGLANATEIAYYTYIYAKVSSDHYPQVTSHVRSGTLIGRFIAATTSQLVISYGLMDYRDLNYLSLGAMILATSWALLLPPVSQSIYFNKTECVQTELDGVDNTERRSYNNAFLLLWEHFSTSYSSWNVIKWSLWWSLATCGYIQVCVYIQTLWSGILEKNERLLNGGVEALLTLFGALGSLSAGALNVNWNRSGEFVLGICSILDGLALISSTVLKNIWVSYCAYILFGTLYQFLITVASFEVARNLSNDSYGLIFGVNTFVALLLQSMLTFIVVSSSGLALDIYTQYNIYGILHTVLGIVFLIFGCTNWCKNSFSV